MLRSPGPTALTSAFPAPPVAVPSLPQEELRTLKYSILKDKLLSVESSRAAQLQWLTEFMVFVGSHHSTLSEYPNLTFQYALNQVGGVCHRGFREGVHPPCGTHHHARCRCCQSLPSHALP